MEKASVTSTPTLWRDAWQRVKMENKLKLVLNAGLEEFCHRGASVFRFHCSFWTFGYVEVHCELSRPVRHLKAVNT